MINRVVLVGRLVRDPELKNTTTGNSLCNFDIAVDDLKKDADGNRTSSFFRCVCFNQTADTLCKYARKGNLVGVDGRLVQRKYVRNDNTNASTVEITCDSVTLLSPKDSNESGTDNRSSSRNEEAVQEQNNVEELDVSDDILPF